jgi:dTDP-4-amino-4,6-dideoxygalactose transaminase
MISIAPWPNYSETEITRVSSVLRSGKVNYWTGNECRSFEREFSDYVGTSFAIALSNGTVALELALAALGVGVGDEVIVSPRSYFASASCIHKVGAIPVFCDVDLETQNIDPKLLIYHVSSKTKAIICVHLAGLMCEMNPILDFAQTHGIYVIEDCAQAHGAALKGVKAGAWGDVACWSFCQDKIMTTGGEGGMITTSSSSIYEKIWTLKDHGKDIGLLSNQLNNDGMFKYVHQNFGTNARLTEMQAVLGRYQLSVLDNWVQERKANAKLLETILIEFPDLYRVPKFSSDFEHAYYRAYTFIQDALPNRQEIRVELIQEMRKLGVPVFSGSSPEIYREPAFQKIDKYRNICCDNARILGETSLAFLTHPGITMDQMNSITSAILDASMKIQSKYV